MEKLILDMKESNAEELRKHRSGPGKRFVFSDNNNNPDGNIYTIVRVVKNINYPEGHIDSHKHTHESMFIFKGDNDDFTGLEAEVLLGDTWHRIQSPKTVRIPAGLSHNCRLLKGSGEYWNIVIVPGADYNSTVE